MESNKSRGERTLLWIKVTLVLAAIEGFLAVPAFRMIFAMKDTNEADLDLGTGLLAVMIGFVCVSLLLGLASCVLAVFWLLWQFRITKNLRTLTTTAFSPWAAVILSCIPYVGLLIHYFIFKNLVKQTEGALAEHGEGSPTSREILAKVKSVPMNLVNGFAIMTVLSAAIGFIRDTSITSVLAVVFSFIAGLCYMKTFGALIKEEQALFEIDQDEKLRKKVDQVLWERELEKNAAQAEAPADKNKA